MFFKFEGVFIDEVPLLHEHSFVPFYIETGEEFKHNMYCLFGAFPHRAQLISILLENE